jgi:CheY-like chemotaxis protein
MSGITASRSVIVLLVEDEALIRMIAADALLEAGFEVLEASNADEAVEILESRDDISIVFSDIDMPGSMDGVKLAEAVRGRWPPIEIVLTSGNRKVPLQDLPERCLFIPKPYQPSSVVETLLQLAA